MLRSSQTRSNQTRSAQTRSHELVFLVAIVALLTSLALADQAAAYDGPERNGIDLSVGFAYGATDTPFFLTENNFPRNESDFEFGLVALRYFHRFNDTWGLEASLSYTDELVSRARDTVFVDVSARWTIFESERTEIYGVFGPGFLVYDRVLLSGTQSHGDHGDELPVDLVRSDETPTAHVGVGALVQLSSRWYLRADARFRQLLDIFGPIDEENFDVSVGIGVRF